MSRPGDVLGRYQILCPLGAGGMASVYAARVLGAAAFEKLVAVKIMLPHLSRDARFERMFADEARVAAQVESAHVVGTLDLGRDEHEGLYQVLDLVLGGSLRELCDARPDEPLPLDVALTILTHAARGLADAHAARGADGAPLGLVHRDVSPHNVLVGVDGRARLADFGVARAAARASQTESGELKGKLGYASPEQLAGKVADARSDVFSLGIVAWETLAGRRLFDADNPLALVDMLVHQPIPSLDSVRSDVPPEVCALVAQMLVRDLDARAQSAGEVARRLEEIGRAHGALATPERLGAFVRERGGTELSALEREIQTRLAAPPVPRPPAAQPAPDPGAPRARALRVGLVLTGLLLVGLVAALAVGGRGALGDEAGGDEAGGDEARGIRTRDPERAAGPEATTRTEPAPGPSAAVVDAGVRDERASPSAPGATVGARERDDPRRTGGTPRRDAPAAVAVSVDPPPPVVEPSPPEEPTPRPGGDLLGLEEFDRE